MPFQPILPTWLAWNNANFTSPTGLTDVRTGQPFQAGGLGLGDFFDATNQEAFQGSYTTNGTLFSGRYRLVQVDSGATAANVKTGTVGYLRAGTFVQSVVITGVGSGQTAGTYNVSATVGSGGGSGAVIQVAVGSGGTVTSATVLLGGYGYSTAPTFTLVTGGTVGTVVAQLNTTPNLVTSSDIAATTTTLVRPVVFLNSITPGNYGFVQELGVATVLASGAIAANAFVAVATGTGTVATSATFTTLTIGQAIDVGISGNTLKVLLDGPVVQD
jgi:hypothetical protein